MSRKMDSIHHNHTLTLVPRPTNYLVITARWIYKVKPSLNGEGERLKARLIA